ncbi:MAG: putative urea ABC transporter substrate-binding protein [Chromatiales bacterium]|jgi:NitT/TauT family transport system substrate-binding protein
MKRFAALILALSLSPAAFAADSFKICWSIYVGWMPWAYGAERGIVKKWGDKYGIDIEVVQINDYIESINQYTAGEFDACTMTNMDALTIPAVGGIDSEAVIVGDFSNGNDGIIIKKGDSVKALKGRTVNLVELSVSHYLLARALDMNGLSERDVKLVNTSDADIAALFVSDENGAAVTWNPPLMQARNAEGAKLVFDSSQIPGEIIDMMVVRSDASDKLKQALVGAWYETLAVITGKDAQAVQAIEYMANASGATVAEFKAQLATTAMFYTPGEAVEFVASQKPKETMEHVRRFSFDKGLFGEMADSPDFVGIAFDDGQVLGDKGNVKLRFTAKWMKGGQ